MSDDERSNFNLDSAAAQSAHTFWACILEPSAYQAVKDDYKSCEPHMQDWVNKRFDTLVKGHTRGYMLGYAAGRESMRAGVKGRIDDAICNAIYKYYSDTSFAQQMAVLEAVQEVWNEANR